VKVRSFQTQQQGSRDAQELRDAARELREAFGQDVNKQLRSKGLLKVERIQATTPTPPTPPTAPTAPTTYVTVPPFAYGPQEGIPQQVVDISIAFFLTVAFIIVGLPLARAFARRMDRRSGTAQIPQEVTSQLGQISQAVDAIALEVERISEGQRFTTRLLSEQRDAASQTLSSGSTR
jgi:hypothetical protein